MKVDRDQALAELQQVFNAIFLDPVTVTPELSAKDVPEWDSLLQVSLVVAVERHFKIRFRVGEVEATSNVGEFAALIARRSNDS
jgi:acyl carrier protein